MVTLERLLWDDFSTKVDHFDDGLDNYSQIVVLRWLLWNNYSKIVVFMPRTKFLALFLSSQNISYKTLFMAIPRGCFFLGLDQS